VFVKYEEDDVFDIFDIFDIFVSHITCHRRLCLKIIITITCFKVKTSFVDLQFSKCFTLIYVSACLF